MMTSSGKRLTVSLGDPGPVYAALQAVLDLHTRRRDQCEGCWATWPCPTIRAVDEQMEWPPAREQVQ